MSKESYDAEKVAEILSKWYNAKQESALLLKKCEKYKKLSKKIMDRLQKNTLKSSKHKVTRKNISRKWIKKAAIPAEVWERYATESKYEQYYLSRAGDKSS